MVRPYGVEKPGPTMTSISQAMQEDHGSSLLDSGFENYWFQGHFQILYTSVHREDVSFGPKVIPRDPKTASF